MQPPEMQSTPPVQPGAFDGEPAPTKWPTVIGTISLVYAILGMLCGLGYTVSTFLTGFFMRLGGMNVDLPGAMKILTLVSGALMLALGIMMVAGAVALLRRKRSGVALLKRWVMLRMLFVLVSVVCGVLMAPAAISFSKAIEAETARVMQEHGKKNPPPAKSDQEHWRTHMISTAVGAAVVSVYPVFLGLFLSRRRISEEVAGWR